MAKARKAKKRSETHLVENFRKLALSSQAVVLLELGKLYKRAKTMRLGLRNEPDQGSMPKKKVIKKSHAKRPVRNAARKKRSSSGRVT
jgi:hypothetical protein